MRSEAGFTLVEVMVATFIMGILSVMGLIMLDNTLSTKNTLENVLGEVQALEQTRSILKSDLAQVTTRLARDEFGFSSEAVFEGGVDLDNVELLTFVRNGNEMPGLSNAASTLQHVQYRFEQGNFIRRTRARVDAVSETPIHDRVLMSDLSSVKVAFFDGTGWGNSWQGFNSSDLQGIAAPPAVSLTLDSKRYGPVQLLFATPAGH
ncbi:type II secretion system minor pseudopilin GspJ [Hirschia litorea]|uniref:Type II secretion system protein J n=1 Tax=Hirschia litorea TaxID=1199156 RepID=A0ABW2IHJ9_9PROT